MSEKYRTMLTCQWVRAILLSVPIQYIGTCNSVALDHRCTC